MNCHECLDLIQRSLDGEPIPDRASLDLHLTNCGDCRAWHAAARRLEQGLSLSSPAVPPVELTSRIVFAVIADQRAVRRFRQRAAAVVAVAAAILLAILVGRSWPPSAGVAPRPPDAIPVVQESLSPRVVPDARQNEPSLRESVAEVAQLTLRKADQTVGQARTFLSGSAAPEVGALPTPLEPPARSLREAGSGVTAGLEPVADSARRALNLFLREIPSMPAEDKRGS